MIPWNWIFPEELSNNLHTIESWISSIFLFLAIITIGPWLLFLLYDLLLYIVRTFTYEFPLIGGRARGRERPRAPSLRERPTGDPRLLGIGVPAATYLEAGDADEQSQQRHEGIEEGRHISVSRSEQQHSEGSRDAGEQHMDQRVGNVGASGKESYWTEHNARRRTGFKEDESSAG